MLVCWLTRAAEVKEKGGSSMLKPVNGDGRVRGGL
jgi:hypothetical protein